MKHTGKPPKKSSSRSPVAGKAGSGRATSRTKGAESPRSKGPEYRKPRNERGREDKPAARYDAKSPRPGNRNPGNRNPENRDQKSRGGADQRGRVTAERADRPARDYDRPKKTYAEKPFRGKAGTTHTARPERTRPERARRTPVQNQESQYEEAAPREKRAPRASLGPRANLFGLHAVREAWLNPKRYIHALYLSETTALQFAPALEQAIRKGLERPEPKILSRDDFDRLLGRDVVHQGIALSAAPLEEHFLQDILSLTANKERSVILMLDQVTDPHNVGAILRSACAFGADGVVMQRRHAPELEGVLAKTASGAADHIPVAYETNLSRTLEELAKAGYVAIGLDEHAEKSLAEIDVPAKAVLILGAEGDGMRRLIREHCDVLVTLPTRAPIASLNVSNAAAVALYALLNG